jgi:hypothetical protein
VQEEHFADEEDRLDSAAHDEKGTGDATEKVEEDAVRWGIMIGRQFG